MRAATRGLGQGALLAHAFLPVEGDAVPGREGQPETRGGMTSQNPRCAPSPPPGTPQAEGARPLRPDCGVRPCRRTSGQPLPPVPSSAPAGREPASPGAWELGSHAACLRQTAFLGGCPPHPHRRATPCICVSRPGGPVTAFPRGLPCRRTARSLSQVSRATRVYFL